MDAPSRRPSFREAVLLAGAEGERALAGGVIRSVGHWGATPPPFDGVDSSHLAGPSGSHPLAQFSPADLVRPATDGLDGRIVLDGFVRIGEGIRGRVELTARRDVRARGADLRLVGRRFTERALSKSDTDSEGRTTHTDSWVEVASDVIEDLAYGDVALPATLVARQSFAADFVIPAPRLGPPTAHLGSALVAWAVYARWDIPYGGDERLAAPVEVVPHPAHFRAVVAGSLAPGSLHDAWAVGDATLAVHPLPPAVPGGTIDVSIVWPGAGTGRGARVELQAHVRAPNDLAGLVLDSIAVDPAALRGGTTVRLSVPPDAPPSLALDGIGIEYRVRALVDRPFRPDLAVERPIAVAGLHGG